MKKLENNYMNSLTKSNFRKCFKPKKNPWPINVGLTRMMADDRWPMAGEGLQFTGDR
jgi:hypothetical protein